ncbi:MAG TPA: hypothetical protein VEI73_08340 [Candidatus Acidoferrum sp.]|nr:hypothetical protein [Candidatus Acidoferrum sp.]
MKPLDFLLDGKSLTILFLLGLAAFHTTAQERPKVFSHPPTSFSAEDDKFPGAASLPECVRHLLASDDHVVNALKYENRSPEQLPAEWFTASEKDLGQNNGKLLIVMGAGLMRGANINPFWIFRTSAQSCDLLLNVGAHDLDILRARTNGLPDISIVSLTAIRYFEAKFSFDGRGYQEVSRSSGPIGEEVPVDLSYYDTRKPLVQGVAQNPDTVLSEARAWLWKQWWLEKPSYLTVTLHSKEGDETSTTYFIRKTGGQLDVLIRIHRVLVDRRHHVRAGHPLVEDEILVASDVQRRWALENNPDRTVEVPEGQEVEPDLYELYMIDDSESNVVIL